MSSNVYLTIGYFSLQSTPINIDATKPLYPTLSFIIDNTSTILQAIAQNLHKKPHPEKDTVFLPTLFF